MALSEPLLTASVTSGANDDKPRCYFTSIAGEVRNRIYDYTFTPPVEQSVDRLFPAGGIHQHERWLKIIEKTSPSRGLLLVCKQVYAEAEPVFRERCHQNYWMTTKFTVFSYDDTVDDIEALNEGDVACIHHLQIVRYLYSQTLRLTLENGI